MRIRVAQIYFEIHVSDYFTQVLLEVLQISQNNHDNYVCRGFDGISSAHRTSIFPYNKGLKETRKYNYDKFNKTLEFENI